jgi:hypothetical protein
MERVKEYWVYDHDTQDICRDEQGLIKRFKTNEAAMEYGFENLNHFHTVANVELG